MPKSTRQQEEPLKLPPISQIAFLLSAPSLMASPLYWVEYSLQGAFFNPIDSGQQSVTSLPLSWGNDRGGHGSVVANLTPTDMHFLIQASVDNPLTDIANFGGIFTAFDTISVVSQTLAPNTPVDLGFMLVLTSSASTIGSPGVCSPSTVVTPNSWAWVRADWNIDGNREFNAACNDVNGTQTLSAIVHSFVGASVPLQYHLGWSVFAGTNLGLTNSSATIQAPHTGFVDIQVLTPGADYSSASGLRFNYTDSTVPEPSSALLVVGGIAILWKLKGSIKRDRINAKV